VATSDKFAEYWAPYEASVAKLQAALRKEDRKAVARLVSYPLRVNVDRCPKHIKNSRQLGRYYEVAFPAKLRKRVIADKPPYMTNWRGLGVASGELWLEDSDDGEPKVFATNTDVWDIPELPCADRVIEATPPSLSGRWQVVAAFGLLPDVDPAKAWSTERSGWLQVDADRVRWDYSNRRGSCRIDHFARETEEPLRPVTPAADGLRSYDGHTRFVRLDCRPESGGNVASVGRSGAGGLYYLGPERIAVAGDGFKWMVMAKHAKGRRRKVVGSGKPCGQPGVECAPGLVCAAQGGYRDERCESLERY
jgi:hypothetical protein